MPLMPLEEFYGFDSFTKFRLSSGGWSRKDARYVGAGRMVDGENKYWRRGLTLYVSLLILLKSNISSSLHDGPNFA